MGRELTINTVVVIILFMIAIAIFVYFAFFTKQSASESVLNIFDMIMGIFKNI